MPAALTEAAVQPGLLRSPFVREIQLGTGKWFVYNSLLNSPRIVDSTSYQILNFFERRRSRDDYLAQFSGDAIAVLDELIEANLIIHDGFDEREAIIERQREFLSDAVSGRRLRKLEIAISDACNLRCPHCMHFNNNDVPTSAKLQSISTASIALAIENFIAALPKDFDDVVLVHFGNGEPLINWQGVEFAVNYCNNLDVRFEFAINSNLTLVTKEIAAFAAAHKIRVSTSLDGTREVNDRQRKSRNGIGSFNATVRGMRLLQEAGHPVNGFTATITDANFDDTDEALIDLAVELGIREIAMDFDLVNNTKYGVDECVNLVFGLRQYARTKGISLFGNWETPFKMLISQSWSKSAYAYCPAMDGSTLEFGVNGDIKTCGHTNTVVAERFDARSALSEGSRYHRLLEERLPNNMSICKGCEIEGACGGQCHVTQEASKTDYKLLPRMCEIMQKMTKRLVIEQYAGSAEL